MEPLMTPDEVAALLQVDIVVIHQLVNDGELPVYRIAGNARFEPSEVAEYLRSQRRASPQAGEKSCPLVDAVMQISRKVLFNVRLGCVAGMHDALTAAQQEAVLLGHHYIGTEHLLVGVMHEEQGVAVQVLRTLGIDAHRVRRAVMARMSAGELPVFAKPGEGNLTRPASNALTFAMEEACLLGHSWLGTEHLLLGLLREGEDVAAQILADLGVTLQQARVQMMQVLARQRTRSFLFAY
jgi:excisionase family DNA binding protein